MRWGCIQPLTGGMYIGAAQALNEDADWIISYPGTDDVKYDKDGNIVTAGNEYNLLKWLEKNNKNVPYFHFNHKMFEQPSIYSVEINPVNIHAEVISNYGIFTNVDLIVAVPVCAGLSNVTIAADETKDERNCNMIWIANYVLNICKPKVYIFENAPALVSNKGESVRNQLENIAIKAGYSVLYYKTDTKLHNNPQKRPRTFVCFFKHTVDGIINQLPPELGFENIQVDAAEYIDNIPENATQQIPFAMSDLNSMLLNFIKSREGENWRNNIHNDLIKYITKNKLYDEFCDYICNTDYDDVEKRKSIKFIRHVEFKKSQGLNFYSTTMCMYDKNTPSVQFKTIQTMLHHREDRLITVREALHLMGLPHDFELYGDINANGPKIGQNVPVNTARFIVSEAAKVIENWDNIHRETGKSNTLLVDNTKQQIMNI